MQAVPLAPLSPGYNVPPRPMPVLFTPDGGGSTGEEPAPHGRAEGAGETAPRALIVDDAPDVTEMLAIFLRHAGYETVMAFSAAAALAEARRGSFDVVVSDIGMPGMDGYDLAAALRAIPGYAQVPLIAVTGFPMYDDHGRAAASGFNAHLTKPIDPIALLDLIKSLRD